MFAKTPTNYLLICVYSVLCTPWYSYVEVDCVLERIYELQNDAGKEYDKHDDRPHPLPHDHPCELHVLGDWLSQLGEKPAEM